jgi:hypothetical protein
VVAPARETAQPLAIHGAPAATVSAEWGRIAFISAAMASPSMTLSPSTTHT